MNDNDVREVLAHSGPFTTCKGCAAWRADLAKYPSDVAEEGYRAVHSLAVYDRRLIADRTDATLGVCPTCRGVVADEGEGVLTAAGALLVADTQYGVGARYPWLRVNWSTVVDRRRDPTGTVVAQLRRLARGLERSGLRVAAVPPAKVPVDHPTGPAAGPPLTDEERAWLAIDATAP